MIEAKDSNLLEHGFISFPSFLSWLYDKFLTVAVNTRAKAVDFKAMKAIETDFDWGTLMADSILLLSWF